MPASVPSTSASITSTQLPLKSMDSILPAPRVFQDSAQFVPPKPGAGIQVIGAGLPRTGTNSLSAAVSILLDGPTYHVGFQTTNTSDPSHFKNWIEILKLRLYGSEQDRSRIHAILKRELDGYVALADSPVCQLLPELIELYPDAKVVCSTRDLETWANSMATVAKVTNPNQLQFFFFWIRSLRHFPAMIRLLIKMFENIYGVWAVNEENCKVIWETHHTWCRTIVPKDRLFFIDVKDGWEPLCKALGVPVPGNTPFPRFNDSKTLEGAFRLWVVQGLTIWAVMMVCFLVLGGLIVWSVRVQK